MSEEAIRSLARRAARCNLRLRDARALFDALYIADALALSGGSVTRAAARSGVNRECIHKIRRKGEIKP